jgi:hypothetical protein
MIALPKSDSSACIIIELKIANSQTKYKEIITMKKLSSLFFAAAMMFSVVFISEAVSSNSPFSAQAQVTVKKKNRGVVGAVAGGGKYVYRKAKQGGYYVYRGGKYVGKAAYRGGKYATVKTVQGTKYVGRKTVGGTKKVYSKTKKVVVGQ